MVFEQGHNFVEINDELLNNILKLVVDAGVGYGVSQIVAAVCFLGVVYVTGINYRSKQLPR